MASASLVPVARAGTSYNVTEDKSQSPRNIIECSNAEKFRYDDCLAISVFKLLSYVVMVDVWLGEDGEIRHHTNIGARPPRDVALGD